MNRATISVVILVVTVALSICGTLPDLSQYLQGKIPNLNWIIVYTNLTLLAAYMVASDYLSKAELSETMHDWSKSLLEVDRVKVLHESEFYKDFEQKLQSARKNVDICHFGKVPPVRSGPEEEDYYSRFKRAVRLSPAKIRRLERLTFEKVQWIESQIVDFKGQKNYSLSCLLDSDLESDQITPVSVQRVDGSEVYLVALGEHYSTEGYRDVYINSEAVAVLIARYFSDRLWAKSMIIIDQGTLKKDNWEHCKKWLSAGRK